MTSESISQEPANEVNEASVSAEPQSTSLMRAEAERPEPHEFDVESRGIPPLPVQLDVYIPLPSFRVRDLLSLEKGRVLASNWQSSEDLPLWAGQVQLVWTEFEVVDQKLAVRVTRLL